METGDTVPYSKFLELEIVEVGPDYSVGLLTLPPYCRTEMLCNTHSITEFQLVEGSARLLVGLRHNPHSLTLDETVPIAPLTLHILDTHPRLMALPRRNMSSVVRVTHRPEYVSGDMSMSNQFFTVRDNGRYL